MVVSSAGECPALRWGAGNRFQVVPSAVRPCVLAGALKFCPIWPKSLPESRCLRGTLRRWPVSRGSTYGISRVDNETSRTHGWLVTIQRRGVIYRKHFSDGVFGGKQRSLQRRRNIATRSSLPIRPCRCRSIPTSSKEQPLGRGRRLPLLRLETRDLPEEKQRWFWVASWPLPDGRRKRVKFSVKNTARTGLSRWPWMRARPPLTSWWGLSIRVLSAARQPSSGRSAPVGGRTEDCGCRGRAAKRGSGGSVATFSFCYRQGQIDHPGQDAVEQGSPEGSCEIRHHKALHEAGYRPEHQPLITKVKSPRVRMVIGRVISISSGRMIALTKPSSTALMSAAV